MQWAQDGTIPKPEARGEYSFLETMRGMVAHFRKQADAITEGRASNRDRREKAEADSAEIAAAKDKEDCVSKADAVQLWTSAIIRARTIIEETVSQPERGVLLEKLKGVTLEP